jgi:hypothetical protein
MNLKKLSSKSVSKSLIILLVLVVVGFGGWYIFKQRSSEESGGETDNVEGLVGDSYKHIFEENINPEVYARDPIGAINVSVVAVEGGERSLVQESWSVARLWDFIFASYLLGSGSDSEILKERALTGREYLYSNAVPFVDLSEEEDAEYMSSNRLSVCYPLKHRSLLSQEEREFFVDSCLSQYSDPDWMTSDCKFNGYMETNDLEQLFSFIKADDGANIEAFKDEFKIDDVWNSGDKAVDYYILQDYIDEIIPIYEDAWRDWNFENQDIMNEFTGISKDKEKLLKCVKSNGLKDISRTLIYLYENKIKSVDDESKKEFWGFEKTATYSLISTLEYLKNQQSLNEDSRSLFNDISVYLIEEPDFFDRDYSYYHGMKYVALTELCLNDDNTNVEYIQEIWDLNEDNYNGSTACTYVNEVVEKLLRTGYCTKENSCLKYMLFDEPSIGEDGVARFSASSADTLRVLFDIILIHRKNEN